ncbi:MAG: hypothetical protein WC654_05925 [Patescibacteria group bacterium]
MRVGIVVPVQVQLRITLPHLEIGAVVAISLVNGSSQLSDSICITEPSARAVDSEFYFEAFLRESNKEYLVEVHTLIKQS